MFVFEYINRTICPSMTAGVALRSYVMTFDINLQSLLFNYNILVLLVSWAVGPPARLQLVLSRMHADLRLGLGRARFLHFATLPGNLYRIINIYILCIWLQYFRTAVLRRFEILLRCFIIRFGIYAKLTNQHDNDTASVHI